MDPGAQAWISEWVAKELRSSLARATRAGHRATTTEPRAARAHYCALENALHIELTNGAAITLPVKLRLPPQSTRD